MANVIESFSYDLSKAALVQQAKDKAEQGGQSFSKYIVRLIERDLKNWRAQKSRSRY